MSAAERALKYTGYDVVAVWFVLHIQHQAWKLKVSPEEAISRSPEIPCATNPQYWVELPDDASHDICLIGYDNWAPPAPSLELYQRGEELRAAGIQLVTSELSFHDKAQLWSRHMRVVESPLVFWQTRQEFQDSIYSAHALRSKELESTFLDDFNEQQRIRPYHEESKTEYWAYIFDRTVDPMWDIFPHIEICARDEEISNVEMAAQAYSAIARNVTVYIEGQSTIYMYLGDDLISTRHYSVDPNISYTNGQRETDDLWEW